MSDDKRQPGPDNLHCGMECPYLQESPDQDHHFYDATCSLTGRSLMFHDFWIMDCDVPDNSYKHFTNRDCAYWPCHDLPSINCLFCFCPLYNLEDCGGEWTKTPKGIKDCSKCSLPHGPDGWDKIMARLKLEKSC